MLLSYRLVAVDSRPLRLLASAPLRKVGGSPSDYRTGMAKAGPGRRAPVDGPLPPGGGDASAPGLLSGAGGSNVRSRTPGRPTEEMPE
jgi:hypothetical protein